MCLRTLALVSAQPLTCNVAALFILTAPHTLSSMVATSGRRQLRFCKPSGELVRCSLHTALFRSPPAPPPREPTYKTKQGRIRGSVRTRLDSSLGTYLLPGHSHPLSALQPTYIRTSRYLLADLNILAVISRILAPAISPRPLTRSLSNLERLYLNM